MSDDRVTPGDGVTAAAAPRWPVVLFDFDGTLADSVDLIMASFRAALGESVPQAELLSWIGRPLRLLMEEVRPGESEATMATYRDFYRKHHDELIRPVPGVPELLRALAGAGVRIGVVSSKRADFIELGLAALDMMGSVDILASQDDTPLHKPHPDPLLLAARRLAVEPAECVYVGDAVVDIQAGRAAGMGTVGVTWGAGTRTALLAAGPSAVADDVPELASVLLPA
ncbi:HAD family hydrolase [Microlunatus ginsengisoli]|uniref:HAD family hydrolase n=1 Tax=Microlunatus ginsengisoli TaxID=363863 RepID=A0ABP6ZZ65_9ACTN